MIVGDKYASRDCTGNSIGVSLQNQEAFLKFRYLCCFMNCFTQVAADTYLLHLLCRSCQHELDTVQLVYFGSTRVVVDGHDVTFRMAATKFLDNALTYHMVRQTGKRLGADNVRYAGMDELNHLRSKEPTLTGLVTGRNDILRILCQSE